MAGVIDVRAWAPECDLTLLGQKVDMVLRALSQREGA